MSGGRQKRDISGWLILDKPYDMTSTQAVGRVRWLFGARKAGHAGTLDPLATGLLPIALGEATKTVPLVQDGQKVYRFAVAWGAETTTDDAEGEVTQRSEHRPAQAEVEAALPAFTGEIMQTPPAFSAIKIAGERAYDLARAGEQVTLEPRPVFIASLRLLSHARDRSEFEMSCEKGTYVRALARDLARTLGTFGHVIELRRTAVGPFTVTNSVTMAQIEDAADRDALLQPVTAGMSGLHELRLDPTQAQAVRHGNPVLLLGTGAPLHIDSAFATLRGQPVALGEVRNGQFHPVRVFSAVLSEPRH